MISTRSAGLVIDTVVCLTLVKWETVSGRFGGYLSEINAYSCRSTAEAGTAAQDTRRNVVQALGAFGPADAKKMPDQPARRGIRHRKQCSPPSPSGSHGS